MSSDVMRKEVCVCALNKKCLLLEVHCAISIGMKMSVIFFCCAFLFIFVLTE